ncbi:dynein light chain roadblock-type [Fistulifera solaris]|uniref:Dynein light chain roadblock-type n=1 Tax=Fistulifera solaris TaxID=1519565 RepID=A0A1Z5KKE8_FISSO|nr:dynein light chain roadblock-type [Fistulifera solaris]|eukprot:GAX26759.1 dynein light chain roadblock-type [Fistulifera solaris]
MTESDTGDVSIQELQDTVSRLASHKGVQSVLILNREGDILAESIVNFTPSLNVDEAPKHELAKQSHKLLTSARAYLQSLDPNDEVAFLQLRSKNNHEVMIAPHEGYVLAVSKRL